MSGDDLGCPSSEPAQPSDQVDSGAVTASEAREGDGIADNGHSSVGPPTVDDSTAEGTGDGQAGTDPEPQPGPDDAELDEAELELDEAELDEAELDEAGQEDPVTALARERDEHLDTLRRLQADFENYKKRILRQQTEHLERAAENLVVKLLPALDTLDLALSHHDPDSEAGTALTQVGGTWHDVLAKEGLEKIDPLGQPFDPNEADAVQHEPSEDGGDGPEVVEVFRPGYRWRGRVVRPAMVKVKG